MNKKSYKTLNNYNEKNGEKLLKTVELLAPARDLECAITAINCGADAVYIGAQDFGARKKAGNSLSDIKKIVDYAHLFNVKIYVTVNTLIYDNEISTAEKLINDLYETGVDALIIQDLGILKMNLPPIELHASTQCHNISPEKINFLKSLNISRVVLPREFSLNEIRTVKEQTGLEIEFFVHGALCVSYSGQCYLSQKIGGRSANRGECAQPCRNIYSLVDEDGKIILENKYLLSLKDFCLIDELETLAKSGVYSFKIEGRLKDPDYVKTVVSAYRKKLENLKGVEKSSKGVIVSDFQPDLKKVFNRGFTKYNIGENENINSIDTPKNKGEFVGKAKNIFKNGFEIEPVKGINLNPNDGICAFVDGDLKGSTVTKTEGNKVFLLSDLNLKKGDKIFRNLDFEYQKYAKTALSQRKLPICASVKIEGKEIIFAMYEGDNRAEITVKNEFEPAQKPQKDNIKKQFSKLGDTVFLLENIEISEGMPFIPVSKLNEIRRDLTLKLEKTILKNYQFKRRDLNFTPIEFPKNIENDYKLNVTNKNAKEIYNLGGVAEPQMGYEVSGHIKNAVLMQTKNCLRKLAGICLKNNPKNMATAKKLFLKDKYGNKYPLKFNCGECLMEILDYE